MGADVTTADEPIERFALESLAPSETRLEVLRSHFPEAVGEDGVHLETLARSLGEWVSPEPERFGLHWPGKAACARVVQEPSIGTLAPLRDESLKWETAKNVVIEGDNLEVLKLLQRSYHGKVKLIYIDPPYNTGKEFVYPDNFREGLADYLRYSGQVDTEGLQTSANAETSGRYHSRWLSMMYPRLYLARSLLREDGAILVSIDEHELHHLLALLDEVFGQENFIGTIVWKNATDNNPTRVAIEHEYIVCYARSISHSPAEWKSSDSDARDTLVDVGTRLTAEHSDHAELQDAYTRWFRENKRFLGPLDRYKYIDDGGVYTGSQSVHNPGKEGYRYDVPHPVTGKPCKEPLMGYRFPEETMAQLLEEQRVLFGEDETKIIELKVYAAEFRQKLSSLIELDGRLGANELRKLFPERSRVFTNPKPTALLRELIPFICDGDDLVLDFFAGSGSTGDAVMQLNANTGSDLRFVLVQLPEPVGSTDDEEFLSRLCMERIRRSAATSESEQGFRAYALKPSNFEAWTGVGSLQRLELLADGTTAEASTDSIVTELLLKSGFDLLESVEKLPVKGAELHSVADGQLLIVAEGQLTLDAVEAMAAMEPALILVLDRCFGDDDELKVNTVQTLRAANQGAGANITLKVV